MNERDKRILAQLARRIRERFPKARLWAFGSRARGKGEPDSDLDVCVVVEERTETVRDTVSDIAWEIGFENDLVISTIVFSNEEFYGSPGCASPLVHNILQEGVTV